MITSAISELLVLVQSRGRQEHQTVPSLTELAAKCVASHIPFELVEHVYPPVPEQLQLRIAFWSFPDNEEDIRLYSCLANGAADEFTRGEHLVRNNMVKDPLQIEELYREDLKIAAMVVFARRPSAELSNTCFALHFVSDGIEGRELNTYSTMKNDEDGPGGNATAGHVCHASKDNEPPQEMEKEPGQQQQNRTPRNYDYSVGVCNYSVISLAVAHDRWG
ncbi:hypothetical protein GEV33_004993 [Tenebrio molitor]|uniref:Uncharacterized protein n=1 Tax=Tenebrio molitor TaxID=7067 RepID=A0A8J6HP69_TENMO|nr:hypothetical protein GEV33_004993 [Tenebrio molitor]